MITINVNLPIGPESENKWMAMWGEEAVFFSLDTVKRIHEENPDETDFKYVFNCDGGYVDEGFAIYDYLRQSGKNIYCDIEGGCHSMAIVLLLAAPKENRTANKHCRALIHCVRAGVMGDLTADELKQAAEYCEMEEQQVLDVYADRTGEDRDILSALLKEEKVRDAQFLLDHGFIGKINTYNTNLRRGVRHNSIINPKNSSDMAKTKQEVMNMATNFLAGLKNLLGTATNYDFTDNDGNVLFSTEAEDDTLEVGMPATPDGTFELPDGRTVVISEGVIAEISEPATTGGDEEMEALRTENEALRAQLAEAANVIREQQSVLASNYKPANSGRTAPAKTPAKPTAEQHKEDQRARLGLKKKEA